MQNSVKTEAIIGITSILIFISLIGFSTYQYYQTKKDISTKAASSTSISSQEILSTTLISQHASTADCWIIIDNKVYNVTQYLNLHPGGASRIIPFCGQDATTAFQTQGGRGQHSSTAAQELSLFYIGDVNKNVTAQPNNAAIQQLPVGRGDDDD